MKKPHAAFYSLPGKRGQRKTLGIGIHPGHLGFRIASMVVSAGAAVQFGGSEAIFSNGGEELVVEDMTKRAGLIGDTEEAVLALEIKRESNSGKPASVTVLEAEKAPEAQSRAATVEEVTEVVSGMDPSFKSLFTSAGVPRTDSIEDMLTAAHGVRFTVTAAVRDEAWAAVQSARATG